MDRYLKFWLLFIGGSIFANVVVPPLAGFLWDDYNPLVLHDTHWFEEHPAARDRVLATCPPLLSYQERSTECEYADKAKRY